MDYNTDFLSLDTKSVDDFRICQVSRAERLQELLSAEWALASLVAYSEKTFMISAVTAIQQLHDYHRESALLCIRKRPNVALALTRMACELARDTLIIAQNKETESIWINRETEKENYRRMFRFNESSGPEKALRNLYKITSQFGVHGHQSISLPTGEIIKLADKEFFRSSIDQSWLLNCLDINSMSIELFVLAFLERHGRPLFESSDSRVSSDARKILAAMKRTLNASQQSI
jgi:hypothetical protein